MACDCISKIEKDTNTSIDAAHSFGGGRFAYLNYTANDDVRKKKKRSVLIATYCPFCGKKYKEEKA